MVFSSMTFLLLFLPVTILLYALRRNIKWKNGVLLIASLFFYAWGEPVYILLMLISTGINYLCALGIDRSGSAKNARKLWLFIGVTASMVFLIWFKYAAFMVNSFAGVFSLPYHMAEKKLPIGISFYTFQVLTYTVDVYRKKAAVQKNPARLLLYVSCFPQLIAGPIVQYADVAGMLDDRPFNSRRFSEGARRFAVGLSKKVILANLCGSAISHIDPADASTVVSFAGAWYVALMYTFQIYFDFSAYSDMAIGLGRLFGFDYKENFNYPYVSGSITEFWRRWHISLGSFFRDYVYIPLGGSRCSVRRTIFNMMVVWSLTGFWHGASWNFILWGMYYGLLLITERFVIGRERLNKLPYLLRAPAIFVLAVIGWVLFYHTDLSLAARQLCAMIGIGNHLQLVDPLTAAVVRKYSVLPLMALIAAMPVLPAVRKLADDNRVTRALSYVAATVLMLLSLVFLVGQSYNPFIYFRF
ncbi:MAG: MBOAT family protein [Clostridia bacterium]|nr:MBOAT family protein [Clostridia bacterium]